MVRGNNHISYSKQLYYIICIVTVLIIILYSIWGPEGYRELNKARLELESQRERVEALKQSNSERMNYIHALRSDKDTIESYARKKGYAKKGEIIYQLPEEPEMKSETNKP